MADFSHSGREFGGRAAAIRKLLVGPAQVTSPDPRAHALSRMVDRAETSFHFPSKHAPKTSHFSQNG
jgi:hypothetical protein